MAAMERRVTAQRDLITRLAGLAHALGENEVTPQPVRDHSRSVTNASQEYARLLQDELLQRRRATYRTALSRTYVPPPAEEAVNTLPNTREYRLDDFKASRKDCEKNPYICLDWINRVFALGEEKRLSEAALIQLMSRHALNEPGQAMRELVQRGLSLRDVVIELELNFCDVKHPDTAQNELRVIGRRAGESIYAFGSRIRQLAKMATKDMPEPTQKYEELCLRSFMHALPAEMARTLKARYAERHRLGEPAEDLARALEDAATIEKDIIANAALQNQKEGLSVRQIYRIAGIQKGSRPKGHVGAWKAYYQALYTEQMGRLGLGQVQRIQKKETGERTEYSSDSSEESESERGETESQTSEEETENVRWVNRANQKPRGRDKKGRFLKTKDRPAGRGGKPPPRRPKPRVYMISEYGDEVDVDIANDLLDPRLCNYHYLETAEEEEYGEILVLRTGGPPRRVPYANLNVEPDECARCGLKGHKAIAEIQKCPMREFPLQTKPCPKCNKGGHEAKHCQSKRELYQNQGGAVGDKNNVPRRRPNNPKN